MGFVSSSKLSEYTGKLVTKLRTIFATQNMVGAPKKAATVADMSDTDSIYVYTGSETGYVAGNWYYYDQGSWVSGGVYNAVAVVTDPTLSESGEAADAAAVGSALDRIFSNDAKEILLYLLRHVSRWTADDAEEQIDALEAELFQEGEIVGISAAFVQGGNVIYDNDDLSELEKYLTVSVVYSDSTTRTLTTGYTLSGTLTTGTSVITVTYQSFTTTFNVSVTLNDVRFCEYIETTDATNWIDLGITPSNSRGYKFQAMHRALTDGRLPFGCRGSSSGNDRYWLYIEGSGNVNIGWNSSVNTQKTVTAGTAYTILVNYKNDRKIYINGSQSSNGIPGTLTTISRNIGLLGRNTAGTFAGSATVFYGCELTLGSDVTHIFVPAYKTSTGDIGVYDKLSHTFIGNGNTSGTATGFLKGSDV